MDDFEDVGPIYGSTIAVVPDVAYYFRQGDIVKVGLDKWWHPIANWWREFRWRCRYDFKGIIEDKPWPVNTYKIGFPISSTEVTIGRSGKI